MRPPLHTDLQMTIEFNCRICSAAIRVPDKAAGGKGRCPKCGIRITVPKKSPPKPTEPEEQFVLPGIADDIDLVEERPTGDDSSEVVMLETAGFQPEDLTAPPADEFSLDRPMSSPSPRSAARRFKQRKRAGNPLIIAVAVVLALAGGRGIFLYPILTAEKFPGRTDGRYGQDAGPAVRPDRQIADQSAGRRIGWIVEEARILADSTDEQQYAD